MAGVLFLWSRNGGGRALDFYSRDSSQLGGAFRAALASLIQINAAAAQPLQFQIEGGNQWIRSKNHAEATL